ncbi:MAG: hypothetical protein AABX29_09035 [Nanoarchaeota archaeon]
MEILEHKEVPFPEDLEGRLNAVFNIVNTELKSATLLALDDSPVEASEIKARVRKFVGQGHLPRSPVFGQYCHQSLYPIGAVIEETIRREGVEDIHLAYSLTEAGKRYGRPIATLALQYAVKNNLSLYQILRSTQSTGETRAPLNRIKILKLLYKRGNLREADLVEDMIQGASNIHRSLQDLKKIGFVDYDSIGETQKGKSVIVYRWIDGKNPDDVTPVNQLPTLTKKAARLLRDRGTITSLKAKEVLNALISSISGIYSALVNQGFAIREMDFHGHNVQSNVRLKERAKLFLDFESRVEEILSDRISESEVENIYLNFIGRLDFEEVIRQAVDIYKRVSPRINYHTQEETIDNVMCFLMGNPGARHHEVKRKLGYRSDKVLSSLVKSGTLRKEKVGKEARYYVNE